jgi:hypothetical protein
LFYFPTQTITGQYGTKKSSTPVWLAYMNNNNLMS